MLHTLRFSLQNTVYFIMLTFLVHVLFIFYIQGVSKFKCKTPVPKGKLVPQNMWRYWRGDINRCRYNGGWLYVFSHMLCVTRDSILWFVWSEVMVVRPLRSTKACAGALSFPIAIVVICLASTFLLCNRWTKNFLPRIKKKGKEEE
jgi:hypothetical protein